MVAMELRVEAAPGHEMPAGCFVGMRVGDVLKQGRYEPLRSYSFEQVERRRSAKIDVYRLVGSCAVTLDPEASSTHEVPLASTDPAFAGLRLKVHAQRQGSNEQAKPPKAERLSAMKLRAKDYLQKHGVEEKLAAAVKALLKSQPDDPMDFLCGLLQGGSVERRPEAAPPSSAVPEQPPAAAAREAPWPPAQPEQPPPTCKQPEAKANDQGLPPASPAASPSSPAEVREQARALLSRASEGQELHEALWLASNMEAVRGTSKQRLAEACGSQELREAFKLAKAAAPADVRPCAADALLQAGGAAGQLAPALGKLQGVGGGPGP